MRRLFVCLVLVLCLSPVSASADLFFTEYIEGSSNNKALEIFNPSSVAVPLTGYSVQMFFNGNGSAGLTINLTGTICAGGTYVLAQSAANAAILAAANQTNGAGWFNGDDAVVLRNGTTVIDSIGQAGFDPGTEWGTGLVSTADNTLRRKSTVTTGDTNTTNVFDPALEWDGFATDTSAGLVRGGTCGATTVQFTAATQASAGEAGTLTATVQVAPASANTVTVPFTVAGSAGSGDYTITASPLVIPPGGAGTITITIIDDSVDEANETVVITLGTPTNATFGSVTTHTATITDDDEFVPVVEIYEIQGSANASPYVNTRVETRSNVVTAVGPTGFFMQTPDFRADADSNTSNGIFVFTQTTPSVSVGNEVNVVGTVIEFFTMTEFREGATVMVVGSAPLPSYFTLTPGFLAFESKEGMLVRLTNGRAAAGTDRFGSTMVVAGPNRPFREPGLGGDASPEIFEVDPTDLGGAHVDIIGGATIQLAEGPMAFSFSDYMIWTTTLNFTNPPFPRPARARNNGEMTVAAQNLFRLFDDRDDPTLSPGNEPVLTPADWDARLAMFSAHIRNVLGSPDVLAVSEAESIESLDDLAHQLNSDQPGLNYTAYLLEGNDIGGIDVGFLVRNTVDVDSIEQVGKNDMWIPPGTTTPDELHDRPPLVLRASFTGNGAPFPIAVIAVHQRSLIDVEGTGATGQRVRAKRHEQALRLGLYIQSLQVDDPNIRVVVTGDFNAFEFSDGYVDVMGQITGNLDPAGALVPGTDVVNPNLTNQVLAVAASDRYSYVENGNAQVLDHSLTSAALAAYVRGLQFARANADAPELNAGPSDHDGLVLFVMTDHDGDGLADDNDQCATGDIRATVILGGCDSGAPNLSFQGGCSLTDRLVQIKAGARNHGQFVSEAGKLLQDLTKDGLLTGAQKGAIESCAAQWNK